MISNFCYLTKKYMLQALYTANEAYILQSQHATSILYVSPQVLTFFRVFGVVNEKLFIEPVWFDNVKKADLTESC